MVEMGIIDPTKVVRSAITNATSIANMVLVTESLAADIPEKEKPQMAAVWMEWAAWAVCTKLWTEIRQDIDKTLNGRGIYTTLVFIITYGYC